MSCIVNAAAENISRLSEDYNIYHEVALAFSLGVNEMRRAMSKPMNEHVRANSKKLVS